MRAFDGIHRGSSTPPPERAEPPRQYRVRSGNGRFFLFLLTLAGLGFLLIRPSSHGETAPKTAAASKSASSSTAISSFHLPQGGDLNTPLDKLVILDHPNEFSAPQTDQSTAQASEPVPSPASTTDFTVRILNGGGAAGAAGKLRDELRAKGFSVSTIGNAQSSYANTTVYYQGGKQASAGKVVDALSDPPPTLSENAIAAPADVLVVIGADR